MDLEHWLLCKYEELTYNELDKSIENLWSVLFTTGYLTQQGRTQNGKKRDKKEFDTKIEK